VNLFRVQNTMDQAAPRFLAFQIRPPSSVENTLCVAMPEPILTRTSPGAC
jgi:hypothetical protein